MGDILNSHPSLNIHLTLVGMCQAAVVKMVLLTKFKNDVELLTNLAIVFRFSSLVVVLELILLFFRLVLSIWLKLNMYRLL